jgi:hypothetical protein
MVCFDKNITIRGGNIGVISCATNWLSVHLLFADIFIFICDKFYLSRDSLERQVVFEEIKKMCEQVAQHLDQQYREFSNASFLEEYVTLAHLWERLRVWVPDNQ